MILNQNHAEDGESSSKSWPLAEQLMFFSHILEICEKNIDSLDYSPVAFDPVTKPSRLKNTYRF